jgi:hypothetical protein
MLGVLQETISKLLQAARSLANKSRQRPDSVKRPSAIRNAFREYSEAQRKFMEVADDCSHRRWPDRGAALYYTWKCQKLYIRRQELRFEHLFSGGEFESGNWSSLSAICDRLDKSWSDIDERNTLSNDSTYAELTTEIAGAEHSRTAMGKDLVDGPLHALQRHAEYRTAREAIYEKVHEIDRRLARLLP